MKLYTLKEAQHLIEYYSDLLIGQPLAPNLKSKIIRFDFVEYENGKYRVNCVGSIMGSIQPIHEISNVAEYYNLLRPTEILENLNESEN
jgi:hypothetical protein